MGILTLRAIDGRDETQMTFDVMTGRIWSGNAAARAWADGGLNAVSALSWEIVIRKHMGGQVVDFPNDIPKVPETMKFSLSYENNNGDLWRAGWRPDFSELLGGADHGQSDLWSAVYKTFRGL